MNSDVELCPACRHGVRPGAAFCTFCGSPLSNRGARRERNVNHAHLAAQDQANHQGAPGPGSISVVSAQEAAGRTAAAMPATMAGTGVNPGGGTTVSTKLELVPASAGKRLGAAVLDWLLPLAVLVTTFAIGIAGITQTRRNGFIVYDTGLLVLLGSIGLAVTVAYMFVLLGIEAKSGNTIGNQLMGIRSSDADGYAPGAGAVFVRGIVTGGGLLLGAIVGAVLLAIGQLGLVLFIALPLMVLGAIWAILVVVSSAWDKNGKLEGWQDKAAKTLVFDVHAGRNPVATGGIQGPYSFAPVDLPPVQPVISPVPSPSPASAPAPVPAPAATEPASGSSPAAPAQGALPPHDPNQWRPPTAPRPVPQASVPAVAHPDDDLDRTRMRPGAARAEAVLRIRIDDGQDVQLGGTVLLGRNPAPQPGEATQQLLPVSDPGRSISKTHLHLRVDGDGVWVTDRNSTNGSAVTTPDGLQTRLQPGVAVFVRPGSTVHFGDRSFHLGQA
ncbi:MULTISPECIES: RDD family protein [Paenarthrobacter]|uniref:RDD family protein n=1 Tax=Paenarthrobacter ureafaciens TaxID=37931 RepID=A0AAX3ELX8_PAEUR|nr:MULTISPECIES: RDD family protein [Paenarthrobacter]NKR11078.1 transporter [Arthrobacter sp. M5]NKR17535.1 transporter [Arthrobacter sp. M6]OEH64061.1 transporter [Arthrobacter sp. D4]OEH64627.1 transporter [Arthrobacter sp. D2]MDO5863981.1 RDD family protein [Paenarthrobacter sp. SD-2]